MPVFVRVAEVEAPAEIEEQSLSQAALGRRALGLAGLGLSWDLQHAYRGHGWNRHAGLQYRDE